MHVSRPKARIAMAAVHGSSRKPGEYGTAPVSGISAVVFQTYPNLKALYAAYMAKVASVNSGQFKQNFNDCLSHTTYGEVGWNHLYLHTKAYSVDQMTVESVLLAPAHAAGGDMAVALLVHLERPPGCIRRVRIAVSTGLAYTATNTRPARRPVAWLVMKSGSCNDLDDENHGDEPVDGGAKRRPPPCAGNVVAALLPEVLEAMACVAKDEEPGRSGDARGGKQNERAGDGALDGNHLGSSVCHCEPDIDRCDQG
jgi:hypothetical protein